jgi:hypothetical protein
MQRNRLVNEGATADTSSAPVKAAVLVFLALLGLLLAAMKGPLEGVHWDVPIYLYNAKRLAETDLLASYMAHAPEIVSQLYGQLPAGEWYSEAYWRFRSIGNIIILGAVVDATGDGLAAISLLTWLYTTLLIAGVGFCFAGSQQFCRGADASRRWFSGAAITALLFLLSDIYTYLAGNLVGEVVCLFLLAASVLALLRAITVGYFLWAILSGLLAFSSYVVRTESVWTWIAFLIAYAVTRGGGRDEAIPWKYLLIAALSALVAFLIYASVFHPLADPRHFLAFVRGQTNRPPGGVPTYKLLLVGGGLAWAGSFASLRWLRGVGAVRFGWLWLLLAALPWLPMIFLGGPSQARMFAVLIPPLFVLSTAGWAQLLESADRRPLFAMAALCFGAVVISQSGVYAAIVTSPGVWRLQTVGSFLRIPNYERVDYMPAEMESLSNSIYKSNDKTIVVSGRDVPQEYLNLIRFLGPGYSAAADLALVGDPTNRNHCDDVPAASSEPARFCLGYSSLQALREDLSSHRVLYLRRADGPSSSDGKILLATGHFALEEVGIQTALPNLAITRKR